MESEMAVFFRVSGGDGTDFVRRKPLGKFFGLSMLVEENDVNTLGVRRWNTLPVASWDRLIVDLLHVWPSLVFCPFPVLEKGLDLC